MPHWRLRPTEAERAGGPHVSGKGPAQRKQPARRPDLGQVLDGLSDILLQLVLHRRRAENAEVLLHQRACVSNLGRSRVGATTPAAALSY